MPGSRISPRSAEMELARYAPLHKWEPRVGDLIFWYGWFGKWVGIISSIGVNEIFVLTEAFPSLLMTMDQNDYDKNIRAIKMSKIQSSARGEYHVQQDNIWYFKA